MPFSAGTAFLDALKRSAQRQADVRPGVIQGPVGSDDLWHVKLPGLSEPTIARGAPGYSYAPGMVVYLGAELGGPHLVILQQPGPNVSGSAAYPPPSGAVDEDVLSGTGITRLVPSLFEAGTTTTDVEVQGFGLRPGTRFEAVRRVNGSIEYEPDPDVTVSSIAWVDSETMSCTIAVDEDLVDDYRFDIGLLP